MNRFIKILLALVILFFLPHVSIAQNKPQLNIIGRVLAANGLMSDWIQYIRKDSKGFIWLTFDNGFNRWDGYQAKRFPAFLTDTTLQSSYRFCRPILEDNHGNLFIGTMANGLIKLDRQADQYIRYYHDTDDPESIAGNNIHELLLDNEGHIWIGSIGTGLSRFDPQSGIFENFRIKTLDTNDNRCNNVRSLYIDSHDIFWVGTRNGLYQFDRDKKIFQEINTGIQFMEQTDCYEGMLEDAEGNIWFGTKMGLLKYSRKTRAWEHISTNNPDKPGSDHDAHILSMTEYHTVIKHQIWIGTVAGLKMYDIKTSTLTHFNSKNGYPEVTNTGPVQSLYIDDNDILWAGLEGLTLIDLQDYPCQAFYMHSYPDSIEFVPASCFYQDDQHHLWVGSFHDGLYEYDENFRFLRNYRVLSGDPDSNGNGFSKVFTKIYEDQKKRLWMLTGPTGICLFDLRSKTFKPVEIDIGSSRPTEILVDQADIVWLATSNGLLKGELMGDTKLKCKVLNDHNIKDILIDSKGRLWVITQNIGILGLDPENGPEIRFKKYLHKGYRTGYTLEYNARFMLEDNWGELWYMSEEALFKYDQASDSIIPVDHFNRANDQKIYSFTRDKNGIFWFVWDYGLLYYNPADSTQDKLFRMSSFEGMPFTFLIRNSFYYDDQGYLYYGGQATIGRGFFRFHPDSIRGPNKTLPPLMITDFKINNKPVHLDSNITYTKGLSLAHNQNFFSFEFSALNYRIPARNQYAYMLEGVDDEWIPSGTRKVANYTGVSPGSYVFRVKGSNNDGYWNETGASVHVTIFPPPWRTWWAYSIYGLAFAALLLALRWYDLKRQRLKQSLELEQVEKDKLSELNRLKSRFFANISHEFRTPLTLILGPLDKLLTKNIDEECQKDL
ncbi:MAG: triple tyrosine motif-containing protein, partial [Bacteroidota bacterium]|nr:triple tyrosine motif-containing protein [Bacteroidota bacterium]